MISLRELERAAMEERRRLPRDGSFLHIRQGDPGWPEFSSLDRSRQPREVWRSRDFIVQLFVLIEASNVPRLSVQRFLANQNIRPANRDLRPISWNELMWVKTACGLDHFWGVELFPPARDVVDAAPMRHLWLFEEAPAFAWRRPA